MKPVLLLLACVWGASVAEAPLLSEIPTHFTVDRAGQAAGVTEGGIMFSQTNVVNELDVRLQKFSIGPLFWYISDRGVIFADTDLAALSIYMTREG